jgi:Putative hemolysin
MYLNMKEKLISIEDIQKVHKVFRGFGGKTLAKCVLHISGLNKANHVYDAGKHYKGTDVEAGMLDYVGVARITHNIEVLNQFEGKPFITVSNHPYGHIDGIALIGEVAKVRQDFKVMVNWMLSMVDVMDDHFIGVNPYDPNSIEKSSLAGVKECISHIKKGNSLGFFPAGAISNPEKDNKLRDREWQEGVIKLIQKANVPVVPVYISGRNSKFFYNLGKIDWRLRTVRLCHELANKKGKAMDLVFGDPIMPEELAEYKGIKELGEFLKNKTYLLEDKL